MILEIFSIPKQFIQPPSNKFRILIVFDEKLLRLMGNGTLFQLKLTQSMKRLEQLLSVGVVPFENAKGFYSSFQGAQTTVGWLCPDDVATVAWADEFYLAHTVQDSRTGVDGFRLWPRAIDQDKVVGSLRKVQLFDGNRVDAWVQQNRILGGENSF